MIFDLAERDDEKHARLAGVIERCPDHARLWHSAWVVRSAGTAGDLLEALDEHLERPDRVFVVAVAGGDEYAGWRNVEADFDWLRRNLEGVRLAD